MIENSIKSSINDQGNESMSNNKGSITNALKDDNKKFHPKTENLKIKLCESELF